MFLPKRSIIDVWYASKYTPEIVQDSITDLKWMSAKMLEKTVHFLNVGLVKDTLRRNIPSHQKQQFEHALLNICSEKFAKFTVTHVHQSLFSICNLQLYWKRDTGMHTFPWILRIFLGATLLRKTSCELVLKGGFYKIWRTKEIS